MFFRRLTSLVVGAVLVGVLPAVAWESALTATQRVHLVKALDVLNLTTNDLGFKKDVAEPIAAIPLTRSLIEDPLALPVLGDRVLTVVSSNETASVWQALPCELFDILPCVDIKTQKADVRLDLPGPVHAFLIQATLAAAYLEQSQERLSKDERAYMAASVLGGMFTADIDATSRLAVVAMGVSEETLDAVVQESYILDPTPSASNFVTLVERIDMAPLLKGASLLYAAVDDLSADCATMPWPATPQRFDTALGSIWIGSTGADRYGDSALLILDPGGDDVYFGAAASVNGLLGQSISVVIDLGGDDHYKGSGLLGPGAALWGLSQILDHDGDDVYRAAYAGLGAAVFGAALLDDRDGDDVYRAQGFAQGAAYGGMALLRDVRGNDLYDVGFAGQAYAGMKGLGFLWDGAGNDRYISGGRRHDYDRHDRRYLSMSQGFAIGSRPFAGGGIAALMDVSGNDSYVADIFGQGASYWYSVGMLMDLAGDDTYSVYHYGQGSGIHLSSGLLVDGGGDDQYTGYSLVQGNGHDYAVGMLIDHSGKDQYSADELSQGRGYYNSFGLLVDGLGNDSYLARRANACQGLGHNALFRDYGGVGVLLDLGGKDVYAVDVKDGEHLARPFYGVVYDLK
ncbi:MAG: hypothetical protein OSB41_08105 [Kiritimatiellae bacterium]|nr:hypothetical protein [Kiritimatiellia bacterium]